MIHMKTTTFSVANLTDTEVSRLLAECQRELEKREQHRAAERQRWVDDQYFAFLMHPNATFVQVGDATVVSAFNRNTGMYMGTARPVHGDEFNREVGIAVAYAKAVGIPVPDYI
jgi:hypothetical protein